MMGEINTEYKSNLSCHYESNPPYNEYILRKQEKHASSGDCTMLLYAQVLLKKHYSPYCGTLLSPR
jgi:hypothetical protein